MNKSTDTNCKTCEAIDYALKKIKLELEDLMNDNLPLPQIYKLMGNDFVEERIEYLEGLQGKLEALKRGVKITI